MSQQQPEPSEQHSEHPDGQVAPPTTVPDERPTTPLRAVVTGASSGIVGTERV